MAKIRRLPTRVIIHRLTDDQTETRLKNQAIREKKKGIVMKDKSKQLNGDERIYHEHITKRSTDELRAFIVFSYVGRLKFYLKHGSHSLKSMNVKTSKKNA